MKLVIATYGTEGDTRPLAALGRALLDAGHDVRLLADAATLASAEALGVPSAVLSGDIRGALSDAVLGQGGFRDTSKALAAIATANTAAWMHELAQASAGCDAIVVSGLAAFVGLSVAEYRNVPAIGAGMIPITPTAAFGSPFLPPRRVPRWLNRASHRLVNALLWHAFRRATNAARASVCGLPPRGRVWTDHPMLYGVSPALLSTPADWPDHVRAVGQWRVDTREWTPPRALASFLDAGERPIYIGFGSMTGFDRAAMAAALTAALDGRRALFYPGWSAIDATMLPRTSMAIHHGGSGTSHSATRAGIPSVVVPFAGDQFFWADRLQRLGVAAGAVPGGRVQATALAHAIAFAEREDTRSRAAALGARIAGEDGLTRAVEAIERWTRALRR
ncbi:MULTISPECIES: glycosyltransferase [Burkholderia]|uniref:glycosyltransferase n=1 Tax=Burkholderia TaxID=32008 RepID=UPI00080BA7A3|nr:MULTISPECIES: glycosyltransferase [Burkholderia]MCA8476601.1 glycosyltransferase [Burkholderia multivorans]MDR9050673.1 O-mycaminosyltylonolide 6-deoxyallosyltransferase [Burkholderia multivorans]MDR9057286.1 O-mycaminosyltylonolide 6-deoxyallosyltransferase [Burkholderia multivorans]MDR9063858.1 O-mycaminosyltylonolide 6-deoxyallosyltransferase [Burkholderia multivorans]MDR9067948.1 O-mycaminosyltylonolide 6-deoxyallosyltransferase [Burkholderia multivorans]